MKFKPVFTISAQTALNLMKIQEAQHAVADLPVNSRILRSLRQSARLFTTHYSTMIEGNRLSVDQIDQVISHKGHFPGRERDEKEVLSYYAALTQVEKWAAQGVALSETIIQKIHALVMAGGKTRVKPTPYRKGQNVIKDGATRRIVYLPPEAQDVRPLMKGLVDWIKKADRMPCPLVAAIAHYQFATIHPYYDGNGRTARLLTTLILYKGHFDLKGLYSLEEYYARNLGLYYDAISIGPSHNYYMGRADADITPWIDYFIEGMARACQKVVARMQQAHERDTPDQSEKFRALDPQMRKALELFEDTDTITAQDIAALFGFKPRTCSALCKKWVEKGFLITVDASRKKRCYALARQLRK